MMAPLGLLKEGEKAEIVTHMHGDNIGTHQKYGRTEKGCAGDCSQCQCRHRQPVNERARHIETIGLRTGKLVEVISNSGKGPLVLRVDESRIAMGRSTAMKIYVRRIDQ